MRFDLTVNEFVRDLFLGKKLEVYDPDTWRPYCHVQDFARIIELALAKELRLINGEVFNAGSNGNNFTKRQIIEEILKVQTRKSEIVFLDKGKDMRNYRVNFDKVRSILDFVPLYSVELGIAEILGGLRSGCFLDKDEKYGNYSLFDLP
jgi:nucleoside-diphosphate-sugar epimerase